MPTPSHEHIEDAFRAPDEVIASLPDSTESREARRLVNVAEQLAHECRERTRPVQEEEETS